MVQISWYESSASNCYQTGVVDTIYPDRVYAGFSLSQILATEQTRLQQMESI